MFEFNVQGSENHDTEYFAPLQPMVHKSTVRIDRTTITRVCLAISPLALWLESDHGLPSAALSEDKLKINKMLSETNVVSATNSSVRNDLGLALRKPLSGSHPYHIPTIGKHEDIENANMEDVCLLQKVVCSNNASLVICGDFESTQKTSYKYFGKSSRRRSDIA